MADAIRPHRRDSKVTTPVFRSAQPGSVPSGYPPHMVTRMHFVTLSAYAVFGPALLQTAAEDKTRTTTKGEFRP